MNDKVLGHNKILDTYLKVSLNRPLKIAIEQSGATLHNLHKGILDHVQRWLTNCCASMNDIRRLISPLQTLFAETLEY